MDIKKITFLAVAGMTCMGMMGVPAKRGLRTFHQADGTVITVNLVGDEHFHTFCTNDGLAVQRKADGNFYYRMADKVSDVIAHNPGQRTSAEAAFVGERAMDMSVAKLASVRRDRINARRAASATTQRRASQVPNNGSPRVPVILVQYKDYKFKDTNPQKTFTEFFSTGDVSAHQYFYDQSNGKYTPQFDVYGPFTLSGNRTVYGGNDYSGDDKGVGKMVGEGCLGLNSEIDFSRYDNDGDGECDVVIVLYAGDGEASSYEDDCEDAVWPCQWSLSSSDYGKSLTLDGTKVDKFAVFNELNGRNLSKIDGIGTFCHEFSHCLGLPDFYDTNYAGHFGMANWSLMDYGPYNNDGYTPIGYSAYEKEFMGWIDIEEGAENSFYSLPVFNLGDAATDKAVKLTNPKDKDEYYIIENRANQGWDSYMPDEGLLITHVTYSSSAWNNNTVNDYDMQRMTPVPADNSLKMNRESYMGEIYYLVDEDDLLGDLWPWGNATELTDESVPAAKVNTGSYLGKPVTEITRNADGSISFWVMKAPKPAVASPVGAGHDIKSPSSVTINWTPGDENDVTYTLEIKEHQDITYELVSSTRFNSEDHGWSVNGYGEITDGSIRLGSNKQMGGVTSPAFKTADDGVVTVIATAKYYGSDQSQLKASLLNASGSVIATQLIDLTANDAAYSVLMKGPADTSVKVKLETTANKKRVYIRQADIYTGDATSVVSGDARIAENGDALSRTISGITSTSYTVDGLKEYGTYDYRVKAVPVDTENFGDSKWTDVNTVTLSDSSAITDVETTDDTTADYYNLQGVKVSSSVLTPGIYIMRKGDKVSKIIVK